MGKYKVLRSIDLHYYNIDHNIFIDYDEGPILGKYEMLSKYG